MGLKLKDLKYNTLNDLSDSVNTPQGDRRRTSTTAALRKGLETVYSRRAIVEAPNALVLHAQEIQGAAMYQNRISMLQEQSVAQGAAAAEGAQYTHWEYKVRMNQSDSCMPIPTGGNDKYLRCEITVYSDLASPCPPGSLVTVRYENTELNTNPRIIVNHGSIAIKNIAGSTNSSAPLTTAFGASPAAPLGTPPGNDMTCPSYNQQDANSLDMTYVHGSDYQTGKQLHQNDWANPPENSVSGWALPLKPSEATPSLIPGSLRAPSGINRSSNGRFHKALDLSAKTGTPLYAVAAGTVTVNNPVCFKGKAPSSNGNRITYKTNAGYTITYIHLDMPSPVKKGETVTKGQLLGYVGDTGLSQGAHLHFKVTKGEAILHPADFYPPEWIMMAGTKKPVSTVHRQSLPNIHVPTKETT